jgi:hypothetical protein
VHIHAAMAVGATNAVAGTCTVPTSEAGSPGIRHAGGLSGHPVAQFDLDD